MSALYNANLDVVIDHALTATEDFCDAVIQVCVDAPQGPGFDKLGSQGEIHRIRTQQSGR